MFCQLGVGTFKALAGREEKYLCKVEIHDGGQRRKTGKGGWRAEIGNQGGEGTMRG